MLKLVKVTGNSLSPRFKEGDFVLLARIPFFFTKIKRGDVVAFRHPDHGLLIKTVEVVEPGGTDLFVVGTHPDSIDSRRFGTVQRSDLVGKVLWHLKRPAGVDSE